MQELRRQSLCCMIALQFENGISQTYADQYKNFRNSQKLLLIKELLGVRLLFLQLSTLNDLLSQHKFLCKRT